MTTISAIIPAYNRAGTLPRALASVLGQTRRPDEIIVVDDGSTDGTEAAARSFPEVRILRLDRNAGAGAARNAGIAQSHGEWIAFLDSDDEWLPDKLDVQLAAIGREPPPDLVCTGVTVHYRGAAAEHSLDGASPDAGWSFDRFQNYPFAPSTWLIRRSVFGATGAFDDTMANCEDLEFLARISGRHRMLLLPQPLVIKHNQGDSLDSNVEKTAASYEILFARYPELWARAPQAVLTSLVRLASMYMCAGDAVRARYTLRRAVATQPGSAKAWLLLLASLGGPSIYQRAWYRLA